MTTTEEKKPDYSPKIVEIGSREYDLVPLSDALPRVVLLTFCHVERFVTSGEKAGTSRGVKGEFFATTSVTVEGKAVSVDSGGGSLTAKKAIERLFAAIPGSASEDEYEALDYAGDDFLSQKYVPPARPDFEFSDTVAFDGGVVTLNELREVYEDAASETTETQLASQEAAWRGAVVLKTVFDMFHARAVAGNRKDPYSWARDMVSKWALGDGSEGANRMAHLVKLGKGANTITEAMRLAELSVLERSLINQETASGKGIDRFKNVAIRRVALGKADAVTNPTFKVMSGNAGAALPNEVKGERYLSAEAVLDFLLHIARDVYGIANAADLNDADLCAKVDDVARAAAIRFNGEYGKTYSSYDDEVYDLAVVAFGQVHIAFGGAEDAEDEKSSVATAGLFRRTLELARKWEASSDETEKTAFILASANKRRYLLTGYATEALRAKIVADAEHQRKAEKKAELLEQLDGIDENEADGIVNQKGRKTFASLPLNEAVAKVYSLLSSRKGEGRPNDVSAVLHGLIQMNAADDERRKAAADKIKIAAQ